jgi:hypothetical protein
VIESVEESKVPPPEFRDDGDSTKAIIFGPKSFGELTPEERVSPRSSNHGCPWIQKSSRKATVMIGLALVGVI